MMPISINGENVSETLTGLSVISQKWFEKKLDMPAPNLWPLHCTRKHCKVFHISTLLILGIMQREPHSHIALDIIAHVN